MPAKLYARSRRCGSSIFPIFLSSAPALCGIASADDVAYVVPFLVSYASRFITIHAKSHNADGRCRPQEYFTEMLIKAAINGGRSKAGFAKYPTGHSRGVVPLLIKAVHQSRQFGPLPKALDTSFSY